MANEARIRPRVEIAAEGPSLSLVLPTLAGAIGVLRQLEATCATHGPDATPITEAIRLLEGYRTELEGRLAG
jgi:hypothetical protein